jgi:hypothetical protein
MGFDDQGYWTFFKLVFALASVGVVAIVAVIIMAIWQFVMG